jgi:hypothetical protein
VLSALLVALAARRGPGREVWFPADVITACVVVAPAIP